MGVLDIICLTADPASTTFYGFAYADIYDCNYYGGCLNNVLVKSQANPVSGKNITWSLVSRIDSRNMTGIAKSVYSASFSCSVSAQGVFTMFGWTLNSGRNGPETAYGIRYDPTGTMDTKYNFQGSGAWINMTIDRAYNWTESDAQHKLGYVNNGVTTELVHSVLSKDGSKIYLAKVDEATKTLTAAGNWALNATIHGAVREMVIGNNHLYTFGGVRVLDASAYLTGFPLATINPTTPVGKIYNTSEVFGSRYAQATYLYVYQNTLTLILAQYSGDTRGTIYKINDPDNANSTGPPIANFTNDVTNMDYFVPLGDGTSSTTFALMKRFNSMYVFGNDNGFRYTHEIKVNISDPVGINPNPKKPSTGSSSQNDDSSSTGAIIGAIFGLGVVVGLIFLFIWRSSRTKTANATTSAADKPLPPFPPLNNNYAYPQQPGQNGGPSYYYPAGQHPASSYPLNQDTLTTFLPMAPITSVPQQYQSMQEQMQTLRFSSHPRPSFVTTAYGGEPESTNTVSTTTSGPILGAAAGPSTAAWQPTPFVPPVRLTSSQGTSTPSAGDSPAVATAFSSATAQSSQDPQPIVSQSSVDSPTSSTFTPLSSPPSVPHSTRPSP
ncbi:hypothetical protein BG015_003276 [Linnemannia schmuckeri]|uniref:Transmembrane protein n=1 Tax=Linnemannia schmuckeri TaxID=64567 RepID=A0A9P5S571_9FUNG|nr:hypothetical protein BG015_003276 [Linnemannia schmuckeri]